MWFICLTPKGKDRKGGGDVIEKDPSRTRNRTLLTRKRCSKIIHPLNCSGETDTGVGDARRRCGAGRSRAPGRARNDVGCAFGTVMLSDAKLNRKANEALRLVIIE